MPTLNPRLHQLLSESALGLCDDGYYTDALRKAGIRMEEYFKEMLDYFEPDHELFGVALAHRLLKEREEKVNDTKEVYEPYLQVYNCATKEGKKKQESFRSIVTGTFDVIRNYLAHSSQDLEESEALYAINIINYILLKTEIAFRETVGEFEIDQDLATEQPIYKIPAITKIFKKKPKVKESANLFEKPSLAPTSLVTELSESDRQHCRDLRDSLLSNQGYAKKLATTTDVTKRKALLESSLNELVTDQLDSDYTSEAPLELYSFYFDSTERKQMILDYIFTLL